MVLTAQPRGGMVGAGSCRVRRDKRPGVLYEMARLAYSLERAERDGDHGCGGWYELRGSFAALLWMNGEWPGPLAPDPEDEPFVEAQFQERITWYGGHFNDRADADTAG